MDTDASSLSKTLYEQKIINNLNTNKNEKNFFICRYCDDSFSRLGNVFMF